MSTENIEQSGSVDEAKDQARFAASGGSVAASDDESSISIEYYLQWRKHPDRWYFGGMVHTYKGALLALKQERKDAARTGEGVEWRMIEQKKQRRVMPV